MKIAESTVSMASSRSYIQSGSRAKGGVNISFYETANSMVNSGEQNSSGSDSFLRSGNDDLKSQDYYPVTYSNL